MESRGDARGSRLAAPLQPAAGEEILFKTHRFRQKSMLFAMPLEVVSPGTGIDTEIFGLEPTSECGRHPAWAEQIFWGRKFPEIFPEKR